MKNTKPESIDKVLSCEIPNKNENPILYQVITANTYMVPVV